MSLSSSPPPLTNCKTTTNEDIKLLATMTQLESLEFGSLDLTEANLPLLSAFSFLKELKFYYPKRYSPETQAKTKELLPKVELKFTPQ